MRLLPASLALLGVEVAMAAIAAPRQPDHAQSTRPRAALGVQETGRIAQAAPTAAAAKTSPTQLQPLKGQEGQPDGQTHPDLLWHQEAKRQDSMSSPSGPVTTELGFFTAGGGVYSVSSLDGGLNVVAGKTVTVGGADALVGGAEVSAAPSGVFVNGVEVMFETVTISSSASASMSMSSGVAGTSSVGPSASASGVTSEGLNAPSQSSSGNGAAVPVATAGAGVMAAVGAVVGVLVL